MEKEIAKEIIEYINKRFRSPDHGESYWIMPDGQCISADVGYAQEWWDDCMSIELAEKYGL